MPRRYVAVFAIKSRDYKKKDVLNRGRNNMVKCKIFNASKHLKLIIWWQLNLSTYNFFFCTTLFKNSRHKKGPVKGLFCKRIVSFIEYLQQNLHDG